MKKWIVLTLAVFLLVAVVGCGREPGATTANENKTLAPDFTVYDVDGNPVKLSDFRGKPVVLNFWASWCLPCKAEMPDFQKEFEAQGENVQFLIVNLTDGKQETVAIAHAYVTKQGYTFPVFYDTAIAAARAYGIRSIPATFFIDAEGYVVGQAVGTLSREKLQEGIALILPQK